MTKQKYELVCPKCGSKKITKELIGTDFETVCTDCKYWNRKDYFLEEIVSTDTKSHSQD